MSSAETGRQEEILQPGASKEIVVDYEGEKYMVTLRRSTFEDEVEDEIPRFEIRLGAKSSTRVLKRGIQYRTGAYFRCIDGKLRKVADTEQQLANEIFCLYAEWNKGRYGEEALHAIRNGNNILHSIRGLGVFIEGDPTLGEISGNSREALSPEMIRDINYAVAAIKAKVEKLHINPDSETNP